MNYIELVFGRFHPLVVHLPIGILILAFVFELLTFFKRFENLKPAIQPSIMLGAIAAVASCITGYFLSQEGGYNNKVLLQHQYFGIATAVIALGLFFLRRNLLAAHRNQKKINLLFLFLPVVVLLSITGHLGGSMTHGEEFLSFDFVEQAEETTIIKPITDIDKAVLFTDVVEPILKSKCYSCHSAKKQKGDLRLDQVSFIQQGGEHGKVIVDELPDSSALFKLLLLPLEHDHHMPPKGKPQPSSSEIAIIHAWIEDGANFEMQIKNSKNVQKLRGYITALQSSHKQDWLPSEQVSNANEKIVADLKSKGILILPVAQESNYLSINFINAKSVTDSTLHQMSQLHDQIVWLNLEGTNINNEQLALVARLKNLRWLYINNTEVSDNGIKFLTSLPSLHYLNMVNTHVTDLSADYLSQMKELQKVFVYRTGISKAAINNLGKLRPTLKLDTGNYRLPPLPSDTVVFKKSI